MPWGYTSAQWAAYLKQLNLPSTQSVRVSMLTLSHQHIASVVPATTDLQVNIDATADITRTLQGTIVDPDHQLQVDTASPSDGALGLDRLIQVWHGLHVPSLGLGVWVPVATCRPSKLERDGATIAVEADGKECLHLRGYWRTGFKKGAFVVDVIRQILTMTGEQHYQVPSSAVIRTRLAGDVVMGGGDEDAQPGKVLQRLAASIGCQYYYDAAGVATVRQPPGTPVWTLDSSNSWPPQVQTNWDDMNNATVITGLIPAKSGTVKTKAKKGALASSTSYSFPQVVLTGYARAAAAHGLSAERLAINGVPWLDILFEDRSSDMHTQSQVNVRAQSLLTQRLTEYAAVSVDSVPWFHGSPGDLVSVKSPSGGLSMRLRQASIPVVTDGGSGDGSVMSNGYLTNVRSPNARAMGRR